MSQSVDLIRMPLPLEEASATDLLDEYLECLIAPLVGIVPYPERARLKQETAFHLERMADDHAAAGLGAGEAMRQALADYGSSGQNAEDFLESWFRKQSDRPLSRRFGHGNVIAFATFAIAQVFCAGILQLRVLLPSDSALNYAVSPARFNAMFPKFVPIPEFTPLYALMLLGTLLGPIVVGAVTGWRVPVRAAQAVYGAAIPCVLYTFVAGVLLLPSKEMLLLGVVQTLYWVPAAMLTAAWASSLTRDRRCRGGGAR